MTDIDAYVARLVAEAPPLAPDQIHHISALLSPATSGASSFKTVSRKESNEWHTSTHLGSMRPAA